MEQADIELLVGELENRLDRLRVLYEQYFMGFERVEPHVPKKDVERRVAVLRKEQIRNTGLRFKFQMILQRYSTYQTYWFRISRQIEFGTYKRDVKRATARFGIDPTREAAGDLEPEELTREVLAAPGAPAASAGVARANEITEEEMAELEDGSAFLEPLDEAEDDPFAQISVSAAPARAKLPAEKFPSTVRLALDDLGDPFEEHDPFPKPAAPSAPKIRIAQRPGASALASTPSAPPTDEHRDTERRIPVAPRVIVAKRAPGAEGGSVPAPPVRAPMPSVPSVAPAPAPRAPAAVPAVSVAPVAASAPRAQSTPAQAHPALRAPVAAASPASPGAARPAPVIRPLTPARAAPPPAAAQAASVAPPRAPQTSQAPAAPVASAAPAAAAARAVVVAARPAPAPVPSAAPPPQVAVRNVGDLSGDRFGQIYSKYVETRRVQNEPTHAITRDALAKQLAESTERLKQKHAGKAIDFEVVVKEGKTILRPVVK